MTKSCPSRKSENKPKKRNFLISNSNDQRYTKLTSRYMFLRMAKEMKLAKKNYASSKLSKSKMAANYNHIIVVGIKSIDMPFLILS